MVHFGFLYWYYNPGAVKTVNWTILRVVKKSSLGIKLPRLSLGQGRVQREDQNGGKGSILYATVNRAVWIDWAPCPGPKWLTFRAV